MNAPPRMRTTRIALPLLALALAGCLENDAPAPCQGVAEVIGQAATLAGQQLSVCGYVNGAARSSLVLTQADEPPQSLRLLIDPAAAEQPDIAALLRAVDARTREGGTGAISARVTGVLVAAGPAAASGAEAGDTTLKVLSVADVETQ